MVSKSRRYDVRIDDHGDVVLFYPMSPAGHAWLRENAYDAEFGLLARVVPSGEAQLLIHGMLNDGLTVGSAVACG